MLRRVRMGGIVLRIINLFPAANAKEQRSLRRVFFAVFAARNVFAHLPTFGTGQVVVTSLVNK